MGPTPPKLHARCERCPCCNKPLNGKYNDYEFEGFPIVFRACPDCEIPLLDAWNGGVETFRPIVKKCWAWCIMNVALWEAREGNEQEGQ